MIPLVGTLGRLCLLFLCTALHMLCLVTHCAWQPSTVINHSQEYNCILRLWVLLENPRNWYNVYVFCTRFFFSVRSRHQHGPALDGERFGPQMIWLLASPSCAPLYGALESRLWKLLVHSISLQLQIFLRVIPPWLLILSCVIFPISNLGLSFLQLLPPPVKISFWFTYRFFLILSYIHLYHFKSHFA